MTSSLFPSETNVVQDPVCGMDVIIAQAAGSVQVGEETYYFCSQTCQRTFEDDPEHYIELDEEREER